MNKETFSILTEPTKSLRERSREIEIKEILTPEFQAYLDKLIDTMIVQKGVGIASPQVGKNIRAIVIQPHQEKSRQVLINPELVKTSEAMTDSEEGCFSVPDVYGIVRRHKKVTVRAVNRHGRTEEFELKNFPAFVIQHEIDHLDGILFIDKATRLTDTHGKEIVH